MREHFVFLPVLIPLLTGVVLLPLRRRLVLQRVVAAREPVFRFVRRCSADGPPARRRHHRVRAGRLARAFRHRHGGGPFVGAADADGRRYRAASLFFAFRSIGPRKERYFFYSLIMFLVASVNGALMTGDIFNLYVFFELILISSYLLFTHGGRAGQLKESFKFLLINSVSSAFLLLAIAGLYAV